MSVITKILEKRMTQKDVKQGIGIANDKRYVGGNMTGATKAMDKLKPGLSDHPAIQKALRKANEEIELDEAVTVKKDKYSWGKMVTVHHGSSTSYPLHPEHQSAIQKLKDGEKTSFKDETNSNVHAHREGDKVHLTRPKTSSTKTTVAHSHFNEDVDSDDYKLDKQGRKHKAHKIIFNKGEEEMKEEKKSYKSFIEQHTILRKEDTVDESESHQSKTTMKHISNPTAGEKKAAKDIKPGIKGFTDRVAMLKSAQARGGLKKEEIDEASWPGTPEYKKKFDTDRVTGAGARHDIKKTSTGVIATRRFADNDTAEKAKDEPKRGRGRPKKDKFAEAVEFLIALDEETFDAVMEEGFDSFMEQYEQLDELSKTTLGDYAKKASRDSTITRKIGADFENQAKKARSPGMKAASTSLADKYKAKSWKRREGVDQAINKLTK